MDCVDEYTHNSPQIIYFPQSIPTREVEETIEPSHVFCECKEMCKKYSGCSCLQHSGTYYSNTDINDLKSYKLTYINENMPTYECNEQCKCKNTLCGNKLVQCGPRKGLKVRICDNSNKGEGLFTESAIKSGNFICEYAGEIISDKEALVRFKKNAQLNHMNYIFCIDEHYGEKNIQTFIDPAFYGNIGRYVNHSCQPNCSMVIIRINDSIPVLGLFACKDIEVGEELSYNYGTYQGKCEGSELNRTQCLCGNMLCRGFLPFDSRIM